MNRRQKPCMLNIGCGYRYHPDWVNIDIVAHGKDVIACDVSKGIPFPDESCDVVYHSAVLEHIRSEAAGDFLRDCCRVLRPKGVLRVGVPDLEGVCRLYLEKLNAAINGDPAAIRDYEWLMLEMLDQMVREQSGGKMLEYLKQDPLPNEDFVYGRIGLEGKHIVRSLRRKESPCSPVGLRQMARDSIDRLKSLPGKIGDRFVRLILGRKAYAAYEVGRFRTGGEAHQWMYDRLSLARLMVATGFEEPVQVSATESRIPDWTSFELDSTSDGTIVKPDLLYMEAVKPASPQIL